MSEVLDLSSAISALGVLVAALSALYARHAVGVSKEANRIARESHQLALFDREPRFEMRCTSKGFENGALGFGVLFRIVQGSPAHILRARIHFWYYRWVDGEQDEVLNAVEDLAENMVIKPEDNPIEKLIRLDLTHIIVPTHVKVVGIIEYDDQFGKKWIERRELQNLSIKRYLDELHSDREVYPAGRS